MHLLTCVSTPIGSTSIDLAWNISTDNIGVVGYDVFVNGSGTATYTSDTLTVVATGLSPNTLYAFRVKARDAAGNLSAFSNVLNVTTASDATPPSTPTNLHSTSIGPDSINLDWDNSTDNVGVVGYDVYVNGSATASYTSPISAVTADGLSPSTLYTFRVKARDAAGNLSAFSNVLSVTTAADVTPPSAPASLRSTAIGQDSIDLAWNISTDNVGVVGYDVFVNGSPTATYTSHTLTVTANGLSPNTLYTFRVKARDAAGNLSAFSNVLSVTRHLMLRHQVRRLTCIRLRSVQIQRLAWNISTDNVGVVGYNIYMMYIL